MLVYIHYLHSRSVFLFANALAHEKQADIQVCSLDNIYNIVLVEKPNILLLDATDMHNMHLVNFITDLVEGRVSIGHTKLILLTTPNTYSNQIKHKNIKYVNSDSYLPYNEYYSGSYDTTNRTYILCHLDCLDVERNKIIEKLIYPNNKTIPVKLVNCTQVKHPQNLGTADENTMLELLSGCYAYINISNQYVYDAMMMNKPIINLIENPYMPIELDNLDLENLSIKYDKSEISKHKISNIIKYII